MHLTCYRCGSVVSSTIPDGTEVRALVQCSACKEMDNDGLRQLNARLVAAEEKNAALYRAVRYALNRQQEDPDFRWTCGWGTQTFYLLIQAEAAQLGKPLEEVEKRRMVDMQPPYRKRAAVEEVRELCTCPATTGAIRCQRPAGHPGAHRGGEPTTRVVLWGEPEVTP